MGLGTKMTYFDTLNKTTLLSSIPENETRPPSRSYGYTAGAYYRGYFWTDRVFPLSDMSSGLKGVPASLTLGGYDENRFERHSTSFSLAPGGAPVVAINEITVSANPLPSARSQPNWSSNPLTLLGPADAALFTIDSSTPFLWLPESVCDRFAQALDLRYNDVLELYTFARNSSQRDNLVSWNMTFVFSVGDLVGSSNTLDITLPYNAFDLQLSYPFPGLNATFASPRYNYFPLRRAANTSQYTIGRSFLQESYLIVDYERNNFSISQAVFTNNALANASLEPILRIPSRSNERIGSLRVGAFAGIVVGSVVGAFASVVLIVLYLRHRRARSESAAATAKRAAADSERRRRRRPNRNRFTSWLVELPHSVLSRDNSQQRQAAEVSAEQTILEMPGPRYDVVELPADAPVELEGSEPCPMKDGLEVLAHDVSTPSPSSQLSASSTLSAPSSSSSGCCPDTKEVR